MTQEGPGLTGRQTEQKRLVTQCLMSNAGGHITADDILYALRQQGTPVGKTTVYRVLKQLEQAGRVRKYAVGEGDSACYQYVARPESCAGHYHAMCTACGQVLHMHSRTLPALCDELQGEYGFSVDDTRTVMYGTCRDCAAPAKGEGV